MLRRAEQHGCRPARHTRDIAEIVAAAGLSANWLVVVVERFKCWVLTGNYQITIWVTCLG